MKTMTRILPATFLLALLSFTMACPTTKVPVADAQADAQTSDAGVDDVGSASACTKACMNLRTLGCPEGSPDAGDSCETVCNHTVQSGVFDMKPKCLAAAKTLAELHACGTVSCKR